jgi:uncharacterized protein YpiB (UPF0302 family)
MNEGTGYDNHIVETLAFVDNIKEKKRTVEMDQLRVECYKALYIGG